MYMLLCVQAAVACSCNASSTHSPCSSTETGTRSAPAAIRLLRAPMAPGFSNQTFSPGLSRVQTIR